MRAARIVKQRDRSKRPAGMPPSVLASKLARPSAPLPPPDDDEIEANGAAGPARLDRIPRKSGGQNWIAGAIKKPGALTASAKKAGTSPMAFAREHKGDSGVTGRRARLALTLSKLRKK